MKKWGLLVFLVILGCGFARLGYTSNAAFFDDLWSQLFWLVATTIATTFVLEHVLQADAAARLRKSDAFAFRNFTGNALARLQYIALPTTQASVTPLGQAVFDRHEFARWVRGADTLVQGASAIDPAAYGNRYLDMATFLRDLSFGSIRIFSRNKNEMVQRFGELQQLAERWNYKPALDEGFRAYTATLDAGSAERMRREAQTAAQMNEALQVLKATSSYLLAIVEVAAHSNGVPAE